MKILFYMFIFGLIVFLNLGFYFPSLMAVNEEDIGRNINHLKKYKWFQELLKDKECNQLIVHDKGVRKIIGKFDTKKIDKKLFRNSYQRKLQHILEQKSNNFA